MTSQITPSNIDGTYPIAGQDNSSQGFRDNFTNIKNNFTYAASEISDLQSKVILKSALTGGSAVSNDMQGNVISNAKIQGFRETYYDFGAVSGSQTVNFNNGSYQSITLGGSTIIDFSNVPAAGSQVRFRLQVVVINTGFTLTLPASVSLNLSTIAGAVGQVITFTDLGTYILEFSTVDGGVTYSINDLTRARDTVQGGSLAIQTIVANAATTGINMTVTNIGGVAVGNITATNFIGNLISTGNSASYSGNVTANYFIANTGYVGNILTPIQANITLLGTQTSLAVSGNANVGNLVVSGVTDVCSTFSATGIQLVANAATGSSTQLWSNVSTVIIAPNALISSYTITMPTTPVNGHIVYIGFANTITTLTHTVTGGQTLKGGFATANANVGGQWTYLTATSTWYKIS